MRIFKMQNDVPQCHLQCHFWFMYFLNKTFTLSLSHSQKKTNDKVQLPIMNYDRICHKNPLMWHEKNNQDGKNAIFCWSFSSKM